MNRELKEAVSFFTREKGIMSSLRVTCGDLTRTEYAFDGEARPGVPVADSTLYDLASVTKLFTGMTVLALRDRGQLDPERPVTDYDARFVNLKDVSTETLLRFGAELKTPGRVDDRPDAVSAEGCLFQVRNEGNPGRRPYSDIPAMVLKYVIEGATGRSFYDNIRSLILEPAGMTETYARVPAERLGDCVCYDLEHRIEKDRLILNSGILPGTPHDPKARKISPDGDNLCGHAGLFSTAGDLVKFCRAVLRGDILSADTLKEMGTNRTGRKLEDGTWSQFLGYQCYVRHPDQYFSEIPVYESDSAFGIGGFTGNHLSVDPEKKIFAIFLGNRVYDRLTVLIPEDGKTYADYGLNPDGTGEYLWPDGHKVYSSVNYVHQKDEHLHAVIKRILEV